MNENKFLNESPEQVILTPNPRKIGITNARAQRAYGLFDSATGTQVTGFKKSIDGQVEFAGLDPNRHYDVGAIEGMGNEKPIFSIVWNPIMKDNTDEILKNSGNLPVEYPCRYLIKDKENNSNNIYNLVDDKGETVGQVMNLSQTGDKPEFTWVCTFRMKDDTKE